jgi:hypothetical protein
MGRWMIPFPQLDAIGISESIFSRHAIEYIANLAIYNTGKTPRLSQHVTPHSETEYSVCVHSRPGRAL